MREDEYQAMEKMRLQADLKEKAKIERSIRRWRITFRILFPLLMATALGTVIWTLWMLGRQ